MIQRNDLLGSYLSIIMYAIIFFIMPIFLILNGLRYFKYKKLVVAGIRPLSPNEYSSYALYNIMGGIGFTLFTVLFFFPNLFQDPFYNILSRFAWIGFLIILSVGYYLTKKDPFSKN
ncbi:MAG: hypothetical protein APG12_01058 [Candidatus Methanofastidiosum methylothiophilum]|uniref:Uncharacterized protein n=1 Tax=Candidatus Methanofastidiosum methylothiophilum TaxID=1705564 RepID=A0A150IYW7_9EURY|nr:MAG: hypothetical protein APG10_00601 [Candidatus Methanofastidiosum methylthiophilus]KYC47910.1 MAG: hypothetical protein APG11_00789 [Candidatus Methanofastidiosum methylthiophilus]KYC50065.1 MAG: hypothetical protein APG12_01058 [Candidatus Methanofastidiosum methylthiophilus]